MMSIVRPACRRLAVALRAWFFAAALLAVAGLATLGAERCAAQVPFPPPAVPAPVSVQIQPPRVVGHWIGATKEDGTLTLAVNPIPGRELTYEFSGGDKQHAAGTFYLRGANELDFTPTGAAEAEEWTYSFDDQGRLHLTMEEDNPADIEEYVLSRVGR